SDLSPYSRHARTAPSTTTPGARSPPIASTAMRAIAIPPGSLLDRDELAAAVGTAGRTDLVAEGRLVAVGAAAHVGSRQLPVRATLQLLLRSEERRVGKGGRAR